MQDTKCISDHCFNIYNNLNLPDDLVCRLYALVDNALMLYCFRHLRSGYGGLLRMNPVFAEFGLKDLLPLKLDIPDEGCTRTNRSQYCFDAGETCFDVL